MNLTCVSCVLCLGELQLWSRVERCITDEDLPLMPTKDCSFFPFKRNCVCYMSNIMSIILQAYVISTNTVKC